MSHIKRMLGILALVIAMGTSESFVSTIGAQETKQREPLVGRVEEMAGGGEPLLPQDLLKGGAGDGSIPLAGGVAQSGTLPLTLKGQWEGNVKITQMDTYPAIHPEPYCQQFIDEIKRYFHLGKNGSIELRFAPTAEGKIAVDSSNVRFFRGLAIGLTSQVSPALVQPGTNVPSTVRNDVQELGAERVEQVRIDYVRIVDQWNRPIHAGFTEVSTEYQLRAPRRMRVKILNIDYDQSGKPLWKCLMEGDARRWSSD
jgi:hypothetical protein